jgi:hypothetical protein
MIDVSVAEHDRVERRRIEGERLAIALVALASALNQAAVEQDPPLPVLDEVTGPGDFPGGSVK